ncbi:hypothetical protein CPB83DRAFT_800165 [Crepidotus variabilis]|uniref:Uncharacterized protein n=1 Tax=Crepidotus variabilis TaxID=179855 RepID=A0A9P6E5K9_9AGAR|nr:hypothetical protein CPB83DRAFT_800165 [Crepidotus variabilis]
MGTESCLRLLFRVVVGQNYINFPRPLGSQIATPIALAAAIRHLRFNMTNTDVNIDERVEIFIRALFGQVCISCAAIGIEIFMWIFGFCIFLETPKDRRRGRAVYLAISFAILVLDCFARLPFAKYSFEVLYKSSNTSEVHELEVQLIQTWYVQGTNWANTIIIWVGNGLLVYRCFIIWADRLLVPVFLVLLYLGSIATSIGSLVIRDDELNISIINASIALIIALECLVTLLISGRLIAFQRKQAAALKSFDSQMYISVIGILVESALPLSIVGIMHIVASIYAAPPYAMH